MLRHRSTSALFAILVICMFAPPRLAKADTDGQYFKETGHTAQDWYWRFWQNTPNALRILGYPISEPFMAESFTEPGKHYRVQYFERAVLEEHPENLGRDNNQFYILGRLLGDELIKGRENEFGRRASTSHRQ